MRLLILGIVWLSALLLAGCKSAEHQTAPVKGKVTSKGQPVTSGQLFFYPLEEQRDGRKNPGKPAFANIEKDGTYRLSTYGQFDGAVVGRHRVSYVNSGGGDEEEGKPPAYLMPEDKAETEVVDGANEINFELIINPQAANWKPRPRPRDD